MKRIIISSILSFFSFTSYTQIIDEIIAIVGNEVVLSSDIETQYLQYLSQGRSYQTAELQGPSREIKIQLILPSTLYLNIKVS